MTRDKVLKDAAAATIEREGDFGSPQDNLGLVADLWEQYINNIEPHPTYLYKTITAKDVGIMMILFKVARIASKHSDKETKLHHDTLVDIAGYAAITSELAEEVD